MVGNKAGGLKAKTANMKKYGPDFYRNIGRKGGLNGHTGGFASNPYLAKIAGAKGGRKSRRHTNAALVLDCHVEEINEALRNGATYKELSERYGFSAETFSRWLSSKRKLIKREEAESEKQEK